MALHTKILIGLLVGAFVGTLANATLGGDHALILWINEYIAGPVGQIFLRLLFMVVMPLVFASIALGVTGIGDVRRVGRIGGKTLVYFLVTTVLSLKTSTWLAEDPAFCRATLLITSDDPDEPIIISHGWHMN